MPDLGDLAGAASMGCRRRNHLLLVHEKATGGSDLDLISYLESNTDGRMKRSVRFPAWNLVLKVVLGIQRGCQSLRSLKRLAMAD